MELLLSTGDLCGDFSGEVVSLLLNALTLDVVNGVNEGDLAAQLLGGVGNVAGHVALIEVGADEFLLQQEFVRSDLYKGDVAGYIADAAKKLGGKVTFVDAVHYVKGEGIEKKADDFAAEVAAQIAGAQK